MIKIIRPMKSQATGFISKKLNRWLSVSTKREPRLSWLISWDQIWFYEQYSQILNLHGFVLTSGARSECAFKPRCSRSLWSSRCWERKERLSVIWPEVLDSAASLTGFPSLHPPWNLQNAVQSLSFCIRFDEPISVHFPQIRGLHILPSGWSRHENRVGLLLSRRNSVGQWLCPKVRKRLQEKLCTPRALGYIPATCYMFPEALTAWYVLIHPTLYKNTLDSLTVFVKYWKHLNLQGWNGHTRLCKAHRFLGGDRPA